MNRNSTIRGVMNYKSLMESNKNVDWFFSEYHQVCVCRERERERERMRFRNDLGM
jgi:hypothetical protein